MERVINPVSTVESYVDFDETVKQKFNYKACKMFNSISH